MNILIADDEPPCRRALEMALSMDQRNKLTFARDGAEAWWHLTDPERSFDLGIFDVNMPSAGGIPLSRRIRAHEKLRLLPIILCTGLVDRTTVMTAAELGLCHCIVKPFATTTLFDRIRLVVSDAEKQLAANEDSALV